MITEAQKQAHHSGIGSSKAAAAMGLCRYSSPFDLWLLLRGLVEPPEETWPMRRGNAMEAPLLDYYADYVGVDVERSPDTIRHPERPWQLCHLDGRTNHLGDRWIVEAKAPGSSAWRYWGEPGTDQIDPQYVPQVQHQMICTGLDRADVVVSIGGAEPMIYTVERDPEFCELLIEAESELWRCVETGEPPMVDGSDAALRWLDEQIGHSNGERREANAHENQLAYHLRELRDQERELLADAAQTVAEIKESMGTVERITGPWGSILWKTQINGRRPFRPKFNED